MLQDVGINASAARMDFAAVAGLRRDPEQTTMQMFPVTIGHDEESYFYFRSFHVKVRGSYTNLGDPIITDLMKEVTGELDKAKRAQLYRQASQQVVDNALILGPLFVQRIISTNDRVLNVEQAAWPGNGDFITYRASVK